MTQHQLYRALCDELTARGIDYRKPDVFGFVAAGWNGDDGQTAEDWADSWEEAAKQDPTRGRSPAE